MEAQPAVVAAQPAVVEAQPAVVEAQPAAGISSELVLKWHRSVQLTAIVVCVTHNDVCITTH